MLATAGIFILNQYFDRENDKINDRKKKLPISSGDISPKRSMIVFFFLIALSIGPVLLVDAAFLLLLLTYLGLWICYSVPNLCLKSIPIVDLMVAGVGAGALPFVMGLQVSYRLTPDIPLPWIIEHYKGVLLCVIPLLLFQSASHIFQAVGDYEADLKSHVHTFVVKYGEKKSVKLGMLLLTLCVLLPILYGVSNLYYSTDFFYWYLVTFICCIPGILYSMNLLRNPSNNNIDTLLHISQKGGPMILVALWVYVLLMRLSLL